MKKGVALKLRGIGGNTAADIVNIHFKKSKTCGKVYYSTNIMFDNSRKLDEVLLYFSHQNKQRYVTADILALDIKKTPFLPADSAQFSPEPYAEEKNRSWFLISNLKEIKDIDNYLVTYSDGISKKLEDVISSPRLNRVYYSIHESSNDDDLLIK